MTVQPWDVLENLLPADALPEDPVEETEPTEEELAAALLPG